MQIFNFTNFEIFSYFKNEFIKYNDNFITETQVINNIDLSFLNMDESIINYILPFYNQLSELLQSIYNNESHQFKDSEENVDKIKTMLFVSAILITHNKIQNDADIDEAEFNKSTKSLLTELRLSGVGYELVSKYVNCLVSTNLLVEKIYNNNLFKCDSETSCSTIYLALIKMVNKYQMNTAMFNENIVNIYNITNNNIDDLYDKINNLNAINNPAALSNNIQLLSETTKKIENMKMDKHMKDKILKYANTSPNIKNGCVYGLKKDSNYKKYLTDNNLKDESSLGADKDGFFVYTHRARSNSYPEPNKIPISKIKFINSTS